MISQCWFNLWFLDDIWYQSSFHMIICHLYKLFKWVVEVFGSFIRLFSYSWILRDLRIFLDKIPLSGIPFANSFFPSVTCVFGVFHPFDGVSHVEKFLIFVTSFLSILYFMGCAFGMYHPNQGHLCFFSCWLKEWKHILIFAAGGSAPNLAVPELCGRSGVLLSLVVWKFCGNLLGRSVLTVGMNDSSLWEGLGPQCG